MSCDLPVNLDEQSSNVHTIAISCNLLILLQNGVYLATAITCNAGGLLHHRFILTKISFGGLLSVALSLGSPRVDVIHHFALRSPDFPLSKDSDCPINSFNSQFYLTCIRLNNYESTTQIFMVGFSIETVKT